MTAAARRVEAEVYRLVADGLIVKATATRRTVARPRLPGAFDHVWRWLKYLPDRKGTPCRILAYGRLNSALVEFEDGYQVRTQRHAVRRRSGVS